MNDSFVLINMKMENNGKMSILKIELSFIPLEEVKNIVPCAKDFPLGSVQLIISPL